MRIDRGERNYQRMLDEENVEFDVKGVRKDGSSMFKHVLIAKSVDDDGYFHRAFMFYERHHQTNTGRKTAESFT